MTFANRTISREINRKRKNMNIQAMMKQAQKLQKDMLKAKEEIDNTIFEGKSSIVTARVKGNKVVESIKINS